MDLNYFAIEGRHTQFDWVLVMEEDYKIEHATIFIDPLT